MFLVLFLLFDLKNFNASAMGGGTNQGESERLRGDSKRGGYRIFSHTQIVCTNHREIFSMVSMYLKKDRKANCIGKGHWKR